MDPNASRGKKRGRSRSHLCDDVVIQILCRLLPRTAIKFQSVSKPWLALIRDHVLRPHMPLAMLGFFYQTRRVRRLTHGDPAGKPPSIPTFKKTEIPWTSVLLSTPTGFCFRILDCCNGLLLCQRKGFKRGSIQSYFVCNPVTQRGHQLVPPTTPHSFSPSEYYAYLAFDPHVSSFFKVLWVKNFTDGSSKSQDYWIFSSKTNELGPARTLKGIHLVSSPRSMRHNGVFWDRALYVAVFHHIVRFGLEQGEDYRVIAFPRGAKRPCNQTFLGRLSGNLCYAVLRGPRSLKVWRLGDADEWLLMHSTMVEGLEAIEAPGPGEGKGIRYKPSILAFHTHLEIIFLLINGRVCTYNLSNATLEDACSLGSETYKVLSATFFPFSPCSLEALSTKIDIHLRALA